MAHSTGIRMTGKQRIMALDYGRQVPALAAEAATWDYVVARLTWAMVGIGIAYRLLVHLLRGQVEGDEAKP